MNDKDLIRAMRRMAVETDSLVCLGCGCEHSCSLHGCAIINKAVARLESLTGPQAAQAEKDGRLVVLPCIPGQTVWCESLTIGKPAYLAAPDVAWIVENIERFGTELFLTREEAEAALEKREEGNGTIDN